MIILAHGSEPADARRDERVADERGDVEQRVGHDERRHPPPAQEDQHEDHEEDDHEGDRPDRALADELELRRQGEEPERPPAGVGDGKDPKRYLVPGDVVEIEVEGAPILRNPVVAG